MRILNQEIPSAVGQTVTVAGWVHRRRRLAAVSFLVLRDRSGLSQVVVKAPETQAQLDELGEETVVQVTGQVAANPQAPGGAEIVDSVIVPLTEPAQTPPIELWRPTIAAGLPVVLDNAPVALRHPAIRAGWEVAAAALHGFRETIDGFGFTEIQTPKIVGTATESGANVFALDYFGGPAYLAQSPQFYKQTMVGVFERVYEVGPVFRAEPHDTVRHLAEYVSLDAEFGFIQNHRDVLAVLRDVVAGMLAAVGSRAAGALDLLGVKVPEIPTEVPVIHFAEALALAGADPDEPDLSPADERAIGEWALREHGSEFVAVEGYPMVKRPFYTHPQPSDPRWSNSFDLLFRGMELVTGGQRLHRYSDYVAALEARGESPEAPAYGSYLQAFKHGMPPHGGFAIGLERFVARLTGAENVREVTLFPRDLHRLTP
ncbi:nondiscriminating aspartyl-tRNA synthetase [Kribbella sp. VKM Ac-2527]|uniref:Aspartate--tRNA(Asp/Asn) ligase n=1 Tax=Kribbella caucasensis TaxID=2512215 RepID=A0A4V3CAT0_9ACTN|nr:aspartate--tRNA(Asn) ligase [Kribbella sp. VKM Ac-2527]TDO52262.1 nondiscriminating aspartyl-tRNA synthetase [Kribbella sp. VKM Ac-2527]